MLICRSVALRSHAWQGDAGGGGAGDGGGGLADVTVFFHAHEPGEGWGGGAHDRVHLWRGVPVPVETSAPNAPEHFECHRCMSHVTHSHDTG